MASKPRPTPNQGQRYESPRKARRTALTWILLTLLSLLVIAAPTMIILFFGMLPTLVALIIDRSPHKSATFCVGGINFIGVFPYIMDLWTGINSVGAAWSSVQDVFVLLIWYASAAFGWLLFLAMPSVIASFVVVLQQRKVALLRGEQKKLIEEWGSEVAGLVEKHRQERQEQHMEGAAPSG